MIHTFVSDKICPLDTRRLLTRKKRRRRRQNYKAPVDYFDISTWKVARNNFFYIITIHRLSSRVAEECLTFLFIFFSFFCRLPKAKTTNCHESFHYSCLMIPKEEGDTKDICLHIKLLLKKKKFLDKEAKTCVKINIIMT